MELSHWHFFTIKDVFWSMSVKTVTNDLKILLQLPACDAQTNHQTTEGVLMVAVGWLTGSLHSSSDEDAALSCQVDDSTEVWWVLASQQLPPQRVLVNQDPR